MDESVTDDTCAIDRQNQEITERFRARALRQIGKRQGKETRSALGPHTAKSGLRVSVSDFDVEAFLYHFDGMEMTDAEKHEVLHALWEIMCRFVELGFGLDSNTLAQKSASPCGKLNTDDANEPVDLVK